MATLVKRYNTVRPSIEGQIFHQQRQLAIVNILLDTGATNSFISWQFCMNNQLVPIAGQNELTRTPFQRDAQTEIFNDISIWLIDDNNVRHHLNIISISSIINTVYDFPVVIGMDVLSTANFILFANQKEFILNFPI